ncbi:hypothetical protein SELMODRAFT_445497 [Selaginella moellendorffii]|uniref:Meiosis-specific protein ASY3-like coiled-coil domain-containing protein n=1 Tax=Selaginella moellendorffii TaxID=88036 RepID=D8SJ34_SELML|nr:hypothetical protein SELMODRAFT_445497 [Selaginella moellendorffii]
MHSEIGDETFIIAALMAMRHPRAIVLSGALTVLALMTVFCTVLGRILSHEGTSIVLPLVEEKLEGSTHGKSRIRKFFCAPIFLEVYSFPRFHFLADQNQAFTFLAEWEIEAGSQRLPSRVFELARVFLDECAMESPRMDPAAGDVEEIINALDPNSSVELDLAWLRGVLENVQIHSFQRRHCGRLEELLTRLQSIQRPEILVTEEFFEALAKLYDNLVTGDFTRREVLSLNLQLLFVIEDLSDHPQGKVLSGKHFITRLLTLACAKSGSLKLKRASVETLCALITRSAENQKFLILHVTGCYKLFKVFLPKCGDFQLQASAAEILFRLTRRHKRLLDIVDDDAAKRAMLSMHEMKRPDVKTGIRNFVNLVNESLGASRSVHSFRALQVFIDGNEHTPHEEVWVHIGVDHISYYTNSPSKEFEGAAEIMDFDFKNIKEIKARYLEASGRCCRSNKNYSTLSVFFRRARLSSLNATVPPSSSQIPWTGKTSIGIAVPLPRITDFPIMSGCADDKTTRDVLVPTTIDNVVPGLDTDTKDNVKVPHSPEVPSHSIPDVAEVEEKENVGHLRSKLKAMLDGPTKKAIDKLKVIQERSPSVQRQIQAPIHTRARGRPRKKAAPKTQKPEEKVLCAVELSENDKPTKLFRERKLPPRPTKEAAAPLKPLFSATKEMIAEVELSENDKPAKLFRERELLPAPNNDAAPPLEFGNPLVSATKGIIAEEYDKPAKLFRERELPPAPTNDAAPLEFGKPLFNATKEMVVEVDLSVNDRPAKLFRERPAPSNDAAPPLEFGKPLISATKEMVVEVELSENDRPAKLFRERELPPAPSNDAAPPVEFGKPLFSATKEMTEIKTRRRRRYTLAELTSGIEHVNLASETKRPKFEKDNSVTPESPICDPCDDDDMDRVVVLFANMLNKFKKKLQSRVRDKTAHIITSTSEAIKSEAASVELQIKKGTDDYAQQCRDKLGRIELDLHEKAKSFKKLCEDFDNLFKHHSEQLEQIQTQMECTDDELNALSEKRKLTQRKLIAQMQMRGEELLSEAESKILAVRKAAKHMQGFKEILQQLVMDTVEL